MMHPSPLSADDAPLPPSQLMMPPSPPLSLCQVHPA